MVARLSDDPVVARGGHVTMAVPAPVHPCGKPDRLDCLVFSHLPRAPKELLCGAPHVAPGNEYPGLRVSRPVGLWTRSRGPLRGRKDQARLSALFVSFGLAA